MTKYKLFLYLLLLPLVLLFCGSCNERYFNLTKVNRQLRKGEFKLVVQNNSPGFLDNAFAGSVKECAIKFLEKKGYTYTEKAKKEFVIELSIDSSTKYNFVFAGPTPMAIYGKGYPKYITINIKCINLKNEQRAWANTFEAYFFCNYPQDLHRARTLVKYLLRALPEQAI